MTLLKDKFCFVFFSGKSLCLAPKAPQAESIYKNKFNVSVGMRARRMKLLLFRFSIVTAFSWLFRHSSNVGNKNKLTKDLVRELRNEMAEIYSRKF